MAPRCIFITMVSLLTGCMPVSPQTHALQLSAPPSNRIVPQLPRSDIGLAPDWFLGAWRVEETTCRLRLEPSAAHALTGPVTSEDCTPPWIGARSWRRSGDGRALFEIVSEDGRILWRAFAIQPTAIAGASGEGRLIRLYWADEGTHGGWVQPGGEPRP